MPGIELNISFGFDDLPADGEHCARCEEPITGKVYHPYIQPGKAIDAKLIDRPLCEACYNEIMGNKET